MRRKALRRAQLEVEKMRCPFFRKPKIKYCDDLIVDVGMHRGNDTDFYLKKGFRVAAIEANPSHVEKAKERFSAEIGKGLLTIYNIGIAKEEGVFDFYINEDKDDWCSFDRIWGTKQNEGVDTKWRTEKIKCTQLNKILEETGVPYYLKVDIEGYDIYCIEALHKLDKLPRFVSTEAIHIDILCHLRALGYNEFQFVNQRLLPLVKCPNPPREGNYVDAVFDGFSSGLFGNELPSDEWMGIEDMTYNYLHFIKGFPERGNLEEGWYDFHAKLW